MATLAQLRVLLDLDDKLSGALAKTRDNLNSWGADLRRIGTMATVGLTTPIVGGFAKIVMSASDLNEAASATEAVYGKASKSVLAWAKTTADGFGITQTEALGATTMLGAMFKGLGFTEEAAAGFSMQMVEAAGDLASFYNADPSEVLENIRSGLVGEYEPLRKYGIMLSEAAVQQRALEMTGKASADQLTEGEKAAARQALIMEQLGDAHGDAARTANGLANMIRRLRARGADLAAQWGQKLLPFATKFVDHLIKLTDRFERLSPRVQTFAVVLAAVAAALGPVLIALGFMLPAIAVLLSPIGLVIAAVGVLGAAFATNFLGIRDAIGTVVEEVVYFSKAMIEAFDSGTGVQKLVESFPGPLRGVARGFLLISDAIGDVVAAYRSGGFKAMLSAIPEEINQLLQGLGSIVGTVVNIAIDTAVSIAGWLWDHKDDIWGGIKSLVGWTTDTFSDAVSATVDGAIELGSWLASVSADFGGWLWRQIKAGWNGIFPSETFSIQGGLKLAGELFDASQNLASWVWEHFFKSGNFILPVALFNLSAKLGLTDADRTFTDFAASIGRGAADAIANLASIASDIGRAIADKVSSIQWRSLITSDSFNFGESLGVAVRGAIGKVAGLAREIGGGIVDVLKKLPDLSVDDLTHVATIVLKALAAAIVAPIGMGVTIISAISGFFKGLIFGEGDVDMSKVATAVLNALGSAITGATDLAGTVIGKIASALKSAITADAFVSIGSAIASAIWDAMTGWFKGKSLADIIPGLGADESGGGGLPSDVFGAQGAGGAPMFEGKVGFVSPGTLDLLQGSGVAGAAQRAMESLDGVAKAAQNAASALKTHVENMKRDGTSNLTALATEAVRRATQMQTDVSRLAQTMGLGVQREFQTMRTAAGSAVNALASEALGRFGQLVSQATSQANALRAGVVAALNGMRSQVPGIMAGFSGAVTGPLNALRGSSGSIAQGIGNAIGAGLNAGMWQWASTIAQTAATLVRQAMDAARREADAHSPSRKMMALGDDLVSGLLIPIRAGRREVSDAMAGLVAIPAAGGMAAAAMMGGGFGGGGDTHYHVTIAPGAIQVSEAEHGERTADAVFAKFAREMTLYGGGA